MPDLPPLSKATERKLCLRWSELLDQHRLTGEHLGWLDAERDRLRRIAAQAGDVTGRRVSSGVPWSEEGAADHHGGLRASVEVAEARFNDLALEYWGSWLSGGGGYEVFAGWLPAIQRRASEEVASIWRGNSDAVDRWYERASGPAVEKAMLALVKDWRGRARAEELKGLERDLARKEKPQNRSESEGAAEPRKRAESDKGHAKRLQSTITSPTVAKRMEEYLRAKGMSQTEFAVQAQTTERTLRSFRQTGKVRRDIFDNIAKAMGTTREALLKPE